MAGTRSLLSPDLGAQVSCPAAVARSLARVPVPSVLPSPLSVWAINLSVGLSWPGEPSWCYAGRRQWESPATCLIRRRLRRHSKPFLLPLPDFCFPLPTAEVRSMRVELPILNI